MLKLVVRRSTAALGLGLLATGAATTTALLGSGSAGASTSRTSGTITYATQDTWHHVLSVAGLAWDKNNEQRSLRLSVFADGKFAGHVTANRASTQWAKEHHIRGKHAFRALLRVRHKANKVVVLPAGHRTGGLVRHTRHVRPAAGTRIVDVAKKYVGHTRYTYGGSSPHGFDCSGYTKFTYAKADVKKLAAQLRVAASRAGHARGTA